MKGRAGTITHDYKRNGALTTTLFAALGVLTGVVIGQCLPRHRNGEFLKFLRRIDKEVPKTLQVHIICDNYGTHKHPNVTAWLAKHPRFHLHFTPTSSSWLNLVEQRKPQAVRMDGNRRTDPRKGAERANGPRSNRQPIMRHYTSSSPSTNDTKLGAKPVGAVTRTETQKLVVNRHVIPWRCRQVIPSSGVHVLSLDGGLLRVEGGPDGER